MVRGSRGAEPPATPGTQLTAMLQRELRARRPRIKRRRRARGPRVALSDISEASRKTVSPPQAARLAKAAQVARPAGGRCRRERPCEKLSAPPCTLWAPPAPFVSTESVMRRHATGVSASAPLCTVSVAPDMEATTSDSAGGRLTCRVCCAQAWTGGLVWWRAA